MLQKVTVGVGYQIFYLKKDDDVDIFKNMHKKMKMIMTGTESIYYT